MTDSTTPVGISEYWELAHARLKKAAALLSRVRRISLARLGVVLVAILLALGAGEGRWWSWGWLFLPGIAFTVLAVFHERLWRQARDAHRIAEFFHRAALRVDRDTDGDPGSPDTPAAVIRRGAFPPEARTTISEDRRLANRRHRIAQLGDIRLGDHLDLFGPGQLFERLADWRTDAGGETLARWMLHPAPPEEVDSRHEAIRELAPRRDIRETLAATGGLDPWPASRFPIAREWLGPTPEPPDESDESDPAASDSADAEPAKATSAPCGGVVGRRRPAPTENPEPASGETDEAEPDQGEPDREEPNRAEPNREEPNQEEPGQQEADSQRTDEQQPAEEKKARKKPEGPPGAMTEAIYPVCAALLTGNMAGGLFLWWSGDSPLFFLAAVAVAGAMGLWFRSRLREEEETLKLVLPEIGSIRKLARTVNSEEFESPLLEELAERLSRANLELRTLERLEQRLRARRNLLFAPLAAVLFWGMHHLWAIHRWRRRHGQDAKQWILAAGECDALLALAQYAAERPGHVFPELDETPGLEARGLGHPLIPEARLQRNDLRLGRGEADVLIVTGSNMSGKSTLLRTIGANFVLARLGAPVAATTFRLGPLALGASIAVHDSLQDGVSRFLAELLALKAVLDTGSEDEPLLFLLDEVLQGTNSDDRRQAAAALLRELGRRSAVGVMTTHDLSLTELAHALPGRVRNMHFTERVADGAMEFDYQLRDGVLERGNALDLMRLLNLPAPESDVAEFTALPGSGAGREH